MWEIPACADEAAMSGQGAGSGQGQHRPSPLWALQSRRRKGSSQSVVPLCDCWGALRKAAELLVAAGLAVLWGLFRVPHGRASPAVLAVPLAWEQLPARPRRGGGAGLCQNEPR